jgi:hypothetical protein
MNNDEMEKRYNSLNEMIADRNVKLKDIFTEILDCYVTVIGDPNQPVIIVHYNDSLFAIGGFVKNFVYNFTTKPYGGSIVRSINLNDPDLTKYELLEILRSNEQRQVYLVLHSDYDNLAFSSFAEKSGETHVYFSYTDPRYFLSAEKAEETVKLLASEHNIDATVMTTDIKI